MRHSPPITSLLSASLLAASLLAASLLWTACSDDEQSTTDGPTPALEGGNADVLMDAGSPQQDGATIRDSRVDSGQPADSARPIDAFVNANWTIEVVDSDRDPGKQLALALHEGKAYLSYRAEDQGGVLRHATNAGGSWQVEDLTYGSLAGSFTDIGLDSAGVVHIAECDGTPAVYFEQAGGDFAKSPVAPLASGWYLSMAFANDRPYLCHADGRAEQLLLSFYQHSGGWQTQALEGQPLSNQKIGAYCDIAVDSGGVAHISYADQNWMRLKYLTVLPGVDPQIEIVDSGTMGPVGSYTSLALDGDGRPVIAYFRSESDSLELSRKKADGSWEREKIDDVGSIAVYTSLALGSDGAVHVSYFDSNLGAVRFARQTSSGWDKQTIALVGTGMGGFNDLALDASDLAHVAYYNTDAKRLDYAVEK